MNEELQAALIAKLTAALSPLPVFGAVPQDQPWPYVVCGTPTSEPRDTDDSHGALVRVPVRLFTRSGAIAQATQFQDQVEAALHHPDTELSLTTATVINQYVEGAAVDEPSEDGKARETVVTVAILVDDITTGTF